MDETDIFDQQKASLQKGSSAIKPPHGKHPIMSIVKSRIELGGVEKVQKRGRLNIEALLGNGWRRIYSIYQTQTV